MAVRTELESDDLFQLFPPRRPGEGSLLHTVQMALPKLYPDSKTFVDKPMKFSEAEVLKNFRQMMGETGSKPSADQVQVGQELLLALLLLLLLLLFMLLVLLLLLLLLLLFLFLLFLLLLLLILLLLFLLLLLLLLLFLLLLLLMLLVLLVQLPDDCDDAYTVAAAAAAAAAAERNREHFAIRGLNFVHCCFPKFCPKKIFADLS